MENILVAYYSNTGSNRYLAERFARQFSCDIEEIKPNINAVPWLMALSWFKIPSGIRKFKNQPGNYGKVILCGPIWTGQLISPLRGFVRKYRDSIHQLYFATCCGGSDEMKEDRFGYMDVFRRLKAEAGDVPTACQAFPIPLVIPEDQRQENDAIMETRLSDENFTGEILQRFQAFCSRIR